jgi:uridine kinase
MKYSPIMEKLSLAPRLEQLRQDPQGLVAAEEEVFRQRIEAVIAQAEAQKTQIVLLSGPSSSGKTTASRMLAAGLSRDGSRSCRISLDDFYKDRQEVPTWEDGQKNFESVEGLDLEALAQCMEELFCKGKARFPIFDFATGKRSPLSRELTFDDNTCLIFEGLHALNPKLEPCLGGHPAMRLYISVHSDFVDTQGNVVLRARDLRLLRRLLRDLVRRDTNAAGTLMLWDYVLRGEELYLWPYRSLADVHINSTHGYEPFLYRSQAISMLREVGPEDMHRETIQRILEALEGLPDLDRSLVPQNSLLQEFIGVK